MAFGYMARTSALGAVVRKPNRSFVVAPSRTFRTDVQRVHSPAKKASGRLSSSANQMSPPASRLNLLKLVNGTTQRLSGPSQRRQCADAVLRMFVVPESGSIRSSD